MSQRAVGTSVVHEEEGIDNTDDTDEEEEDDDDDGDTYAGYASQGLRLELCGRLSGTIQSLCRRMLQILLS